MKQSRLHVIADACTDASADGITDERPTASPSSVRRLHQRAARQLSRRAPTSLTLHALTSASSQYASTSSLTQALASVPMSPTTHARNPAPTSSPTMLRHHPSYRRSHLRRRQQRRLHRRQRRRHRQQCFDVIPDANALRTDAIDDACADTSADVIDHEVGTSSLAQAPASGAAGAAGAEGAAGTAGAAGVAGIAARRLCRHCGTAGTAGAAGVACQQVQQVMLAASAAGATENVMHARPDHSMTVATWARHERDPRCRWWQDAQRSG